MFRVLMTGIVNTSRTFPDVINLRRKLYKFGNSEENNCITLMLCKEEKVHMMWLTFSVKNNCIFLKPCSQGFDTI